MSQEGLDYSGSAEISNEADVPEVSLGVDESGERTSGLDGSLESKDLPSGGDGAETHKKYSDAYETPETSGDQVEVHEEEPPVGDYSKAYEPAPDAKDDAQKVEAPTDSVEELGQKGSCADGPASLDQEAAKEPVSDVPPVEGGRQPEQTEPQREDAFARIDSTEDGSRDIPPVKKDAAALDAQKAKAPTVEQDAFESTEPAGDTPESEPSAHDAADEAVDDGSAGVETNEGSSERVESQGLKETDENLRKATRERYDENVSMAEKNESLRDYTDHGFEHRDQVIEKSRSAATALSDEVKSGNLDSGLYSSDVNYKDLNASAAYHDTGMGGEGLISYDKETGSFSEIEGDERSTEYGDAVRKNHPLNSSLNVLKDRESLESQGINADKVALESFMHSKSASGVRDLTCETGEGSWDESLNKLDDAVAFYNEKHPGNEISFDRGSFDIKQARTESLALRIGDANRDTDYPGSLHSGERLQAPSLKEGLTAQDVSAAKNAEDEASCYDLATESGREVSDNSKRFVLGEGNIPHCDATFDSNSGQVRESILVRDGDFCPRCTQDAIRDRLGEIGTAQSPDSFGCDVNFGNSSPAEGSSERASYERWADRVSSDTGIKIHLPWE